MSDSGSRSPRATVRKILSLEKEQAEVEIPNELCDLRDLSLDEAIVLVAGNTILQI